VVLDTPLRRRPLTRSLGQLVHPEFG